MEAEYFSGEESVLEPPPSVESPVSFSTKKKVTGPSRGSALTSRFSEMFGIAPSLQRRQRKPRHTRSRGDAANGC